MLQNVLLHVNIPKLSFSSNSGADTISVAESSFSSFLLQDASNLGLGYSIAFAIALLVLVSSLLLSSYFYCRYQNYNPIPNGLALSRVIFVAEEDDDKGSGGDETATVRLDPVAISSYPKLQYTAGKGGEGICSTCLCEYKEGEMLRIVEGGNLGA